SSKSTGQNLNTKGTPSPPQQQQQLPRIPHQPVIFTDRFDGSVNKIDVQFGNLGETSEEQPSHYVSASSSAASAFYSHSEP
ncbi:unnamed protein product, partial [Rotaria magnacalcarata]